MYSGLNHVAHSIAVDIEENNLIRSALSDPDGVPEANMESVNSIKSEVHSLFTDDMKKYENKTSLSIDLKTNSAFAGETKPIGGMGANTGTFNKVGIKLFKQAFQSNYALGKAILHEYYHAADYYSGRATSYFLGYRKNFDAQSSANKLRYKLEERAYNYIFRLGDSTSVFNNVKTQYGY